MTESGGFEYLQHWCFCRDQIALTWISRLSCLTITRYMATQNQMQATWASHQIVDPVPHVMAGLCLKAVLAFALLGASFLLGTFCGC